MIFLPPKNIFSIFFYDSIVEVESLAKEPHMKILFADIKFDSALEVNRCFGVFEPSIRFSRNVF